MVVDLTFFAALLRSSEARPVLLSMAWAAMGFAPATS